MPIDPVVYRSSYAQDAIDIVRSTQSFAGEICPSVSEPGRVTKIVDGAVRVITVVDEIRQQATKFWKQREDKASVGIVFSATLLVAAGLGAIGGGMILGAALLPEAIVAGAGIFAVAVTAGVLASIALSISASYQREAQKHLQQWKDPALEIAQHRQQAASQGYPYLKAKNDLRLQSFAPEEKTALAFKVMANYLSRYNALVAGYRSIDSRAQKADSRFVDEFFKGNPISSFNCADAFGSKEGLPQHLRKAVSIYEQHHLSYQQVVSDAQDRRNGIAQQKDRFLRQADVQKSLLEISLNTQRKTRSHRYDPRVAGRRVGQRSDNLSFEALKMQLDTHFLTVKSDICRNANQQINQIDKWEASRKQLFVAPIGQILQAFVNGCEVDSSACSISSKKAIPAPSVEVRYVFPSFELADPE